MTPRTPAAPPPSLTYAPEGPVECPDCQWSDGGDLRLIETPIGPMLHSDSGEEITTCPGCGVDLWAEDVVERGVGA